MCSTGIAAFDESDECSSCPPLRTELVSASEFAGSGSGADEVDGLLISGTPCCGE